MIFQTYKTTCYGSLFAHFSARKKDCCTNPKSIIALCKRGPLFDSARVWGANLLEHAVPEWLRDKKEPDQGGERGYLLLLETFEGKMFLALPEALRDCGCDQSELLL
jgi:hypothetical protein